MSHYLVPIAVGAACGVALLLVAYRISEQFDRQIVSF